MKALVVTPYYYPKVGGLENYARQLNIALSKQEGWEIVIATSGTVRGVQRESIDDMTVYRLGVWFKLSHTPINLFWPRQLRTIINAEKPDIILAHMPVPSMADAVAFAKGDVPLLVVYHAATIFKAGSLLFNILARIYNLISAHTLRGAARILAVSDFVRDQFPAALQSKTVVVPNAVWHKDIHAHQQPQRASFIFVAQLDHSHAWKGLGDVLKAVSIYQRTYNNAIELTVLGDGDMRAEYEKQVRDLGISDKVHFAGMVTGEAKFSALRKASALVMYPTTGNDAFPTVMLEAWSQYTPVVAAAIGPIPSLICDGRDGFLCKPHDPASLAQTLHEVANMSRTNRRSIAERAARRTAAAYTWEQQAKHVNAVAGEVL